MNSPKKTAGRTKRYLKIACVILVPLLLCVSCYYAFPYVLVAFLDKATEPNIRSKYTGSVKNICHSHDFSIADKLEFVEGIDTSGNEWDCKYLFRMDEETRATVWSEYIEMKQFPKNEYELLDQYIIPELEEKYGIDFPESYYDINEAHGHNLGSMCCFFVTENPTDGWYYVFFYVDNM